MAVQQCRFVQNSSVLHSSMLWHPAPLSLRPHPPLMHELLGAQSWSAPHWPLHVVPLHANGLHMRVTPPTLQLPFPSHILAAVSIGGLVLGHDDARHCVPAGYFRQAPLPSHLPSLPQVAAPSTWHLRLGSPAPAATDVQVPRVAVSVQDTHAPSQAVSQHTFSVEQTRPMLH